MVKRMLFTVLALFVFSGSSVDAQVAEATSFIDRFQNPPASALPWVYWYWMNGNMNRASHRSSGLNPEAEVDFPTLNLPVVAYAVPQDKILNLTQKRDADGRLDWQPTEGSWTILRFGYTPTGGKNGPASIEGTGLEPDALHGDGAEIAFDRFFAKLLKDVGPPAGEALRYLHVDRWETGEQNWTANLLKEFEFGELRDWTRRSERGIRYDSGIATYSKSFSHSKPLDLGVVWCAPWRVDVSDVLQQGENKLEIEVPHRWRNRLLGVRLPEDAGVRTVQWQNGLLGGNAIKSGRHTFSTLNGRWNFDDPEPSGLLGRVMPMQDAEHFSGKESFFECQIACGLPFTFMEMAF